MRTTLIRFALPALAALLLIACTRDRPTPEATAAPTAAATAAAGTTGAASTAVTNTTGAEPVVGVASDTPTPEATAAVTATAEAAAGERFEYTVKPGETLAAIAVKFETEVQTLRELNYLLDDNIFAGQILQVPYKEGMTADGAPTPTPEPYTYEVQPGDSLSSIAMQFDVKPGTLIEVNSIADPNNLAVGSRLLIPGYVPPSTAGNTDTDTGSTDGTGTGAEATGGATGGVTHVVQPGETLSAIAADYGVDAVAILQANNIANGNLIRVGQKLVIPGITAQQALESRGTRHTVASGESLSGIAQQYGVTVEAILAANSLDDPNTIVVGQDLLIPPPQ